MANDQRLTSSILFDNESSGPDAMSTGAISIVAPFTAPEQPRPADELEQQLREVQVDSIEDICRAFDVRITGSYRGVDGEAVEVSIPVSSDETFEINGLTRSDPGLMAMYIRARTYQECARYLSEKGRDTLSDEEIAHLQGVAAYLEESLKESDDE